MKRLGVLGLIVLVVVVAVAAVAWIAMPQQVGPVLLRLNNISAGLREETVTTELGEIHYLEGGQGETVLFVHGIYARKEHWVEMARTLVDEYHVVAIDLPGFGENTGLSDEQYMLDQQQENLLIVLEALDLGTVHIAANSMGAYVSALLAASNPEKVSSFAFIGSPLGVPTPVPSDMDVALAQGHIPLLVRSETEFWHRNEWLSPNIPYVPGPILKGWMRAEVAMAEKNERIWDIVHNRSDVSKVLELAPMLTMPSLIVWCDADRIFHISGSHLLNDALPRSKRVTLENCGHLPMLDQPKKVSKIYSDFLGGDVPNLKVRDRP